jgi:hypothetical protein
MAQVFDLGNVLSTAENIQGARLQNQQRQQTFDANVLAQDVAQRQNVLLQQYFANPTEQSFNAIAAVNPEVASKIQGLETTSLAQTSAQQGIDTTNAKIAVKGATNLINSANPKRFAEIALPELVEQMRLNPDIDVDSFTNEDWLKVGNEIILRQSPVATAGDNPVVPKNASFTTFKNRINGETFTADLTNPEDQTFVRENSNVLIPIAVESIVGTPRDFEPLGKKAQGSVQEEIISLGDSFARVNEIGQEYKREFLTFQGRIKSSVSGLLDKANIDISPEEIEFVKGRKSFVTKVNREFNLYRKLITGAAAAEQELADLKKATINEDLGPVEFEAALEVYQEELQRGLRLKRSLLRNGIRTSDEGFGDAFDDAYLSGADDDPDIRLQELIAEGLDIDAATDRLIEEGYE